MSIKAILFDLDGTLLPMDQDLFVMTYFKMLAKKLEPYGYESEKLFKSIWAGVGAMVKNDGSCLNEEAFWKVFAEIYGERVFDDKPLFEEFYREDFPKVQSVCGFNPMAKEIVELAKTKAKVVLATNPIFPTIATEHRMSWAGLSPDDFELYTTYENIGCSKPNPKYYSEILSRIDCQPEECLMVGNDVDEDMVVAENLGMKVFLLMDCIINKNNRDIEKYPNGGFTELKEYIENL